jgi:hypothetical protein
VQTIQSGSARVSVKVPVTEAGTPVDLTGVLTRTFKFVSPSGATFTRAGSTSGDPKLGVVVYVSAAGEFDEIGRWQVQVQVVFDDASDFWTSVGKFKVKANL